LNMILEEHKLVRMKEVLRHRERKTMGKEGPGKRGEMLLGVLIKESQREIMSKGTQNPRS